MSHYHKLNPLEHDLFLTKAKEAAEQATCTRRKCGSVVASDGEVIGVGFNSPALSDEKHRRCFVEKDSYSSKVTDKTCCIHAEARALLDALRRNPDKIKNSVLYFIAVDDSNGVVYSGKPYCTICSKLALEMGVKEFVLMHSEKELVAYDAGYYNDLSYKY